MLTLRRIGLLTIGLLALLFFGWKNPEADNRCPERFNIRLGDEIWMLPYCTTQPIDERDADIQQIVVSLHGADDHPKSYFDALVEIAHEYDLDRTLILAPHFTRTHNLYPNEQILEWTADLWDYQWGQDATNALEPISSYAAMDRLLAYLTMGQFPSLKNITIVGFSGGGQFTNRYAAANPIQPYLTARGIHLRYVVTSPGSYLYFDNRRRVGDSLNEFSVPPETMTRNCGDWNQYGIGLEKPYRYLRTYHAETLLEQYTERDVYYLIGDQDTMTGFDCRHEFEGEHRYERALVYFNYVQMLVPNEHQLAIAYGIGHQIEMYEHPCAIQWIFYVQTAEECVTYHGEN